ncbi:hypothetical protein GCM10022409_00540 [Hymenobacter glaciei]|uniref:Uncharacterized protein n=1 Tax=Hymenobacter glaciei TaxID=877209 RepID=A0ABP7T6D6_9BACT
MSKSTAETARLFRCRLEELGPLNDMVLAMFTTNQADFGKASPDYADKGYRKGWDASQAAFAGLVPTGVRRASDKDVTKTMAQVAKSLRDPLNFLDLRLSRAAKKGGLTASAADFGLGKVRAGITTRDMEGLDGALGHLLQLVETPANLTALTAQGHTAADTQAFADARQQLGDFNTAQNTNQNAALELTEENIKAGNALWEYVVDALGTGALMYKESQPKKAKTFSMATLLKRIRKEHAASGEGTPPMPGVA